MKKIAVVTTGGDAPGMNPAIRSVVRTALYKNISISGIRRGFLGLYEGDFIPLSSRDVGNIINRGGTILKTARFPEFKDHNIRKKCLEKLKKEKIDGIVIIGGDGSANAAYSIYNEFSYPVVHIPASIDNDLYGTDWTIGFDTAVNTAVEAIDKIRDTATSHERTFIVEVMGREKGNLAVEVAVACGAENVIIPEIEFNLDQLVSSLKQQQEKGKNSALIILAEGAGKAEELAKQLTEKLPDREIRYSVLGYIQRGGSPTYLTRTLATVFGWYAVKFLIDGDYGYMVGIVGNKIEKVPLEKVVSNRKLPDMEKLETIKYMAI
ncbi:MAG TPA: 6-phosphofructokinase [Candidatus Ratteibacteria bacterium]|nr:6-phosphofructokinase [bacterium]HRR96269.1 6-phosphofructokinase [Candidatus Ratteibacteria bacterium]